LVGWFLCECVDDWFVVVMKMGCWVVSVLVICFCVSFWFFDILWFYVVVFGGNLCFVLFCCLVILSGCWFSEWSSSRLLICFVVFLSFMVLLVLRCVLLS